MGCRQSSRLHPLHTHNSPRQQHQHHHEQERPHNHNQTTTNPAQSPAAPIQPHTHTPSHHKQLPNLVPNLQNDSSFLNHHHSNTQVLRIHEALPHSATPHNLSPPQKTLKQHTEPIAPPDDLPPTDAGQHSQQHTEDMTSRGSASDSPPGELPTLSHPASDARSETSVHSPPSPHRPPSSNSPRSPSTEIPQQVSPRLGKTPTIPVQESPASTLNAQRRRSADAVLKKHHVDSAGQSSAMGASGDYAMHRRRSSLQEYNDDSSMVALVNFNSAHSSTPHVNPPTSSTTATTNTVHQHTSPSLPTIADSHTHESPHAHSFSYINPLALNRDPTEAQSPVLSTINTRRRWKQSGGESVEDSSPQTPLTYNSAVIEFTSSNRRQLPSHQSTDVYSSQDDTQSIASVSTASHTDIIDSMRDSIDAYSNGRASSSVDFRSTTEDAPSNQHSALAKSLTSPSRRAFESSNTEIIALDLHLDADDIFQHLQHELNPKNPHILPYSPVSDDDYEDLNTEIMSESEPLEESSVDSDSSPIVVSESKTLKRVEEAFPDVPHQDSSNTEQHDDLMWISKDTSKLARKLKAVSSDEERDGGSGMTSARSELNQDTGHDLSFEDHEEDHSSMLTKRSTFPQRYQQLDTASSAQFSPHKRSVDFSQSGLYSPQEDGVVMHFQLSEDDELMSQGDLMDDIQNDSRFSTDEDEDDMFDDNSSSASAFVLPTIHEEEDVRIELPEAFGVVR